MNAKYSASRLYFLVLKLLLVLAAEILCCLNNCYSQTNALYNQIIFIDTSKSLTNQQKIAALYSLKEKVEKIKLTNDTAYVLLLIKTGDYEFKTADNTTNAINYALTALNINTSLKTKRSISLNILAYKNIGSYYDHLLIYKKALTYYDSVIICCSALKNYTSSQTEALDKRANIFFKTGDYEKAVEESTIGITVSQQQKDTAHYIYFLNRKAQSLFFENNLQEALNGSFKAIALAKGKDSFEMATAYKVLGLIYEKKKMFDSSLYCYKIGLKTRITTNKAYQIASDYNDLANFYLHSLQQYKTAEYFYNQALLYANKMDDSLARSLKKAMIYENLGITGFKQNKLNKASAFFLQSFYYLNIDLHNNILNKPALAQLSTVLNKDLVIELMGTMTSLFLEEYKQTKQKFYLDACIKSSIITDSLITKTRHEMIGEKSKLYWRDKTKGFFSEAMEACYLANNHELALYFIEESRSVLLNDKLNELSASSELPESEALKQEEMQADILKLQQKFAVLAASSNQYQNIQLELLNAKKNYDQFIASLEKKYPSYFEYKYADKAITLKDLQRYLASHKQSFVYYFFGDTVTYILSLTANTSKLSRLSQKEFDKTLLNSFADMCSNNASLNNNYKLFAQTSNLIYKALYQNLKVPKGNVVVCTENLVIPFDALCIDSLGKNFLLYDYDFSYVYSARLLLKQFNNPVAKGEFAGFAPVTFSENLHVNSLPQASDALNVSASYYNDDKLFIDEKASRSNFFRYAPSYSVVSIFSHASADTTDTEPVLFMQDSLIHLSELQQLDNPATKLVLLNACETNVGRQASGEGIYSLARGFTTAGIPSVAATLWKADEQSIYIISEKFNQYLAEGFTKDKALQKAKLYFIQSNNNSEKLFPYYWANMILIGDADALKLQHNFNIGQLISIAVLVLLLSIISFIFFKKHRISNNSFIKFPVTL